MTYGQECLLDVTAVYISSTTSVLFAFSTRDKLAQTCAQQSSLTVLQ